MFTAQDCANGLHLSRPAVCWWIKKLAIKRVPGLSGSGAVALLLSQEQYEALRANTRALQPYVFLCTCVKVLWLQTFVIDDVRVCGSAGDDADAGEELGE